MSYDPMRRRDLQRMTPLELKIRDLVVEVEKMGADGFLTDCVVHLGNAAEALANYIDGAKR